MREAAGEVELWQWQYYCVVPSQGQTRLYSPVNTGVVTQSQESLSSQLINYLWLLRTNCPRFGGICDDHQPHHQQWSSLTTGVLLSDNLKSKVVWISQQVDTMRSDRALMILYLCHHGWAYLLATIFVINLMAMLSTNHAGLPLPPTPTNKSETKTESAGFNAEFFLYLV